MVEVRKVQFVVKASKHRNVRCRCCYDYGNLSDKTRISRESLERAYEHIARWHATLDEPAEVEFAWHGGEPLLLPPEFYVRNMEDQRRIFGERAGMVRNTLQTNLTVLDDERIELLRRFDGVEVSIDPFGGLRVSAEGTDSVRTVLANIDRLRKADVQFGCITVLTKANAAFIPKMVTFYTRLDITHVRILPLFDGTFEGQHEGYEITHDELLEALKAVFEELIRQNSPIRLDPVNRYVNQLIHRYTPGWKPRHYSKREWESVYILELNGDLSGYSETHEPDACRGNLFESPMSDIVRGPAQLRVLERAERRVVQVCGKCSYYGACDGHPIAEGSGRLLTSRQWSREDFECIVDQGMLAYLERRLMELGVIDPATCQVSLPKPSAPMRNIDRLPLQSDVRVHFGDGVTNFSNRLSLSSGTRRNYELPGDGLEYVNAAIVPREPWRAPDERELTALSGDPSAPWRMGLDIGVVHIPDDVIIPLERILEEYGTREALDPKWYRKHATHPEWQSAYDRLQDHLFERYSIRDHGAGIVRLASALPGMKTVTKDEVRDDVRHFYVGLHLDTWEKVHFRSRATAPNRICVNVGREDRYFLFINLSITKMYEALSKQGAQVRDDYYGTDLGHDFMQAFPGYPVTRLRLGPREAYIGPTEHIIHDASSVGKRYPDIAIHILGYFGLPQPRSQRPVAWKCTSPRR